ncbi:LLM class flavin-dependent oxidoreductase [Actinomadura sp. GC306]|nr:LLM class flavin-dependent oxidoreductase [Actinomadura sp. GC306]
MRFDLRNPAEAGTSMADRYEAALDMAEWADRMGFYTVVLSEHHGSEDGYLPSALTMAAAMAARTKRVRIRVAAVVAAFHDPVKLAEDAAVVDTLSRGRLDLVVGAGYVPSEFAMFGAAISDRIRRTVETVAVLRDAWSGRPFERGGREIRVTPAPYTPGGPPLELGGGSEGAARRAARLGIGFMATDAAHWEFYRDEVIRLGRADPGPYLGGDTGFVHLARDVEEGWRRIGPYALHESNAYGRWIHESGTGTADVYRPAESLAGVRASGQYRVLRPDEFADELAAKGPLAIGLMHPMMGGIPPEVGWESLRLLETEVLPALRE